MTEVILTRRQRMVIEIASLLRARNTLLWVQTREEARAERAIIEAAGDAKFPVVFWDCCEGTTTGDGKPGNAQMRDPSAMLEAIRTSDARRIVVLRDLHQWFVPTVLRQLRTLARSLQRRPVDKAQTIIILSPPFAVPPELAGHAAVVDFPLPDRAEMQQLVTDVLSALPPEVQATAIEGGEAGKDAVADALLGLTAEEGAGCLAKSLVTLKRIETRAIGLEKRRVIEREKVLEWIEPNPRGLDAIGGNENVKLWVRKRKVAWTKRARDFGIPVPRGMFLTGISGCGKSEFCKCVAMELGFPLLRMDPGTLKSKFVGESEANFKQALAVAEAVSPCVLWIDEVEKAFAGATGPSGDSGVSANQMGSLLTWMQERQGAVFVVVTANDVSALPPEFMRKGRFDEMFFVDLPTLEEREAIITVSMLRSDRGITPEQAKVVAVATDGYTGAEIAALVPEALFTAFADGERAVTTKDLLDAAASMVPLSLSEVEKISAMRKRARGRFRPAGAARFENQPVARQRSGRTRDFFQRPSNN